MLEERYVVEAARIRELELDRDADLLNPVFGEGVAESPLIMFIGEAPGREEAACGRPFVGKAGKQLDKMLETAGIDRSKVFVTNTVKYRPMKKDGPRTSNRTPSAAEIRFGLDLLREEIVYVDPTIIATLGNVPLTAVMRLAGQIPEDQNVGTLHGMPTVFFISGKARKVFPLYHPAASIYNRELKPVLENDLITLGRYARSLEE
ncbi:MAG: uracil-DNA glycosylase [Clostridiales bacterium]|nr:uracil-DNA glycosylase [Clostridiales bacterium]